MFRSWARRGVCAAAGALLLAGCGVSGGGGPAASSGGGPSATTQPARTGTSAGHAATPGPGGGHTGGDAAGGGVTEASFAELPGGGREVTLPLPGGAYTPSARDGGTDDYRCFLLDPQLKSDAFLTGLEVLPGDSGLLHHAILFRVPSDQVAAAEQVDRQSSGQGWTCFGGSGIPSGEGRSAALDDAGWLGAWAPGGRPVSYGSEAGVPVGAESRIVLQLHYNLSQGSGPDSSGVRVTFAPADSGRTALRTVLLAAPVELPCTAEEQGPLCDRQFALEDLVERFGQNARDRVAGLQLLCDGDMYNPEPGSTQSCDRPVSEVMTVHAVAGHMHLLGRSIAVTLNPEKKSAQTLLDIPVWDFDDQGSIRLPEPVRVAPGDVLRVRCTWDAALRRQLPALSEAPARYVTWGDGTSDEMCLAILTVSA